MMREQAAEPANAVKKRPAKNRIILAGVLLVVAYLTGFLPGYAKGHRQEKELSEARHENRHAHLRDLACLAYLQAIQKDYGLAAGTSTRLFDQTRDIAGQTLDAAGRKSLENLLSLRDPITAKLATGDSAVVNELHSLLVKTRQATASPSSVPKR
jgi:hypothetical protein